LEPGYRGRKEPRLTGTFLHSYWRIKLLGTLLKRRVIENFLLKEDWGRRASLKARS